MRNRIVSFEWVSPADLDDHPLNWRQHPNTQRAVLREALDKIGIAGALLVYRSQKTGRLTIVDGHLRRDVMGAEEKVPVLVLDVTDAEATAIPTTHDPIGAMAKRNDELFESLLGELSKDERFTEIARMLETDRDPAADDDEEAAGAFGDQGKPIYEIAPIYDEGYDGILVACATEAEFAQVRTLLNVPDKIDRKGKVGTCRVITAQEFLKAWPKKSQS
jgi:hypothetical protein